MIKSVARGWMERFAYSFVVPRLHISAEEERVLQKAFAELVLKIKRYCPAGQTRASRLFNPVWPSFAMGPMASGLPELCSFRIDFMVSSFDSPLRA